MSHDRSWKGLKNFSNSTASHLYLFIFLAQLAFSSCAPAAPPKRQASVDSPIAASQTVPDSRSGQPTEPVIPPWQVWDAVVSRPETNSELRQADELVEQGKLREGIDVYRQLESRAGTPREREEIFVRRLGTMLKLGHSRAVLDEITQQVRAQGKKPDDVDASIGLLAAYSYLHLGDRQQTLAWLMLSFRKVHGQGIFARRAMTEARRIVRSIPADEFSNQVQIWSRDQSLAPVFAEERARRQAGGKPEAGQTPDWFNPGMYSKDVYHGNLQEADLNPSAANASPPAGKAVVGVLLPSSGKFAAFSAQIRQGIELALKENGREANISLVFADTAGSAETAVREYERLALQSGAAFVIGPLLVKDAEEVARKSEELQVPFLTFTKRPGVTDLSSVAFRLGATAENQAEELVDYTTKQLRLRTFGILYPNSDSATEYLGVFRKSVEKSQADLLAESAYTPRDSQSATNAVEVLRGKNPEAIFIPDSLEGMFSILEAIRNSSLKNAVLLGSALWNDPIASRGYGQLLDGAIFVTPFFAGSLRPKVVDFVGKYRQVVGREPELLSAQAYDAADLIFSLLEDPGISRQALIDKLRSVDNREGVTGRLTVQPNGEIERHMSVIKIQGGELQEVGTLGFEQSN